MRSTRSPVTERSPPITRDVSGERRVQQGLLKLLEGTEVLCSAAGWPQTPGTKLIKINAEYSFIRGGAFDGVDKIIARRVTHRHRFQCKQGITEMPSTITCCICQCRRPEAFRPYPRTAGPPAGGYLPEPAGCGNAPEHSTEPKTRSSNNSPAF